MKVEIYTGLGTQRRQVWKGELAQLPRIGEDVVIDKEGSKAYTVERIHHWVADKRVELYARMITHALR